MDLQTLKENVARLYLAKNPEADPWIDWGYPNHVLFVAKEARALADRFHANGDLVEAAALLHDIADATMHRSDPRHEEECTALSRRLMLQADFSEDEIKAVLDDIIAPHSCRDILPTTLEAKILATADALAHLQTDFYPYFAWCHFGGTSDDLDFAGFKQWVQKRLEKDFRKKIQFEEIRDEARKYYEALKYVFKR